MKQYKTIPTHRRYEICEDGIIRDIRTKRIKPWHLNKNGYPSVYLITIKGTRSRTIHRLLAVTHLPNPDNKPQVHHIDHNKLNYSLSNLMWVTNKENQDFAVEEGVNSILYQRGENHPRAKYSNADVKKMREMYTNGVRIVDIARRFNAPKGTIHGIVKGNSRKTA